jgi:integrase
MAKRWGLLDRNPVEDVKKFREDNARDRVLSPEEESDILDQAPDFVRPIITLAANTGMRLGEIVNLKWTDVDRKDGAAVLGGFIRVGAESKGHRARHIPINAVVKELLDAQKPVETEKGFVPHIFVNVRFKKHYEPSSVYNSFKAAAGRARVGGVCFHTLRHTAVSRMVAAGIPDRIIMRIVGHTTANMVSRYAHLAPDNLKGATDCLARTGSYKDRTKPSTATPLIGKLLISNGSR